MNQKIKFSRLIPLLISILTVVGGFSLVRAANQYPQSDANPSNNLITGPSSLYLPMVEKNNCNMRSIDSPFSIEIAALHQINPTNTLDENSENEQLIWYNQAFPSLIAALKDICVSWTRVVISWSEFEPSNTDPSGYSNKAWYDNRLKQISQAGVNIIGVINAIPLWANSSGLRCPPITADHLPDYQQFLTFIVNRYSQPPYNIHRWEIFNEADNTWDTLWKSHACFGEFASVYTQILANSYQTIKAIDPNSTILMSGIAYDGFTEYGNPFNRYFPDDVMLMNGANYFDALNFHYFADYHLEWERWGPPENMPICDYGSNPSQLPYDSSGYDVTAKKNYFTNRMDTCYEVNKPVYLTELAEHGFLSDEGSLRNQAYYVIKGYSRALAAGIKNITWYALVSPPTDLYEQGLLDAEFNPKPAYFSYKTMIDELTDHIYNRTIMNSADGEAYEFSHPAAGEKIVAWGNNIPFTISPASTVELTDYLGNRTTIVDGGSTDNDGSVNGSIDILLSMDPMQGSTKILTPVPIPIFIRVINP